MSRLPQITRPTSLRSALAGAGLLAAALGFSAGLVAETVTTPNATPTTTTSASAPATTSLPAHSRPRPLHDMADTPSVLQPSGPINGRIGSGPIDANANPGVGNPSRGPVPTPSGQALTTTLPPPGENVQVFKNNAWLPAQVIKREGNQVFVRYDGQGEASNEWVGPNRLRSR